MLSDYQRNDNPNLAGPFMGNAKGLVHGVSGSLRLGLDLRRPTPGSNGLVLGLEVFGTGMLFPRGGSTPGVATLLGGAVRLTPYNGAVQPWVSAGAAVVLTGGLVRAGLDVGLGVDFRLSRVVSLGPVVRYTQVVQATSVVRSAALDEDARVVQAGVALTLRLPRAR